MGAQGGGPVAQVWRCANRVGFTPSPVGRMDSSRAVRGVGRYQAGRSGVCASASQAWDGPRGDPSRTQVRPVGGPRNRAKPGLRRQDRLELERFPRNQKRSAGSGHSPLSEPQSGGPLGPGLRRAPAESANRSDPAHRAGACDRCADLSWRGIRPPWLCGFCPAGRGAAAATLPAA